MSGVKWAGLAAPAQLEVDGRTFELTNEHPVAYEARIHLGIPGGGLGPTSCMYPGGTGDDGRPPPGLPGYIALRRRVYQHDDMSTQEAGTVTWTASVHVDLSPLMSCDEDGDIDLQGREVATPEKALQLALAQLWQLGRVKWTVTP